VDVNLKVQTQKISAIIVDAKQIQINVSVVNKKEG